ncbi:MAG TPA: hypothetical protein VFW40_13655, partial [Capsulimonadaceae bacterium]|nr:hypothetical protein [Capsulimonadaceae bacterium]
MSTADTAAGLALPASKAQTAAREAVSEPLIVRILLILAALAFLALFLVLPLVSVFVQALHDGWHAYLAAIKDPDSLAAVRVTLT